MTKDIEAYLLILSQRELSPNIVQQIVEFEDITKITEVSGAWNIMVEVENMSDELITRILSIDGIYQCIALTVKNE